MTRAVVFGCARLALALVAGLAIGCGSGSSATDGGGGASGGATAGSGGSAGGGAGGHATGGAGGHASGGAGGHATGGAGDGNDAGTTCDPACTGGYICVGTGTVGGALILPNDAGICPLGSHLGGGGGNSFCERDLSYGCKPIPAGCGDTVTCACAAALCETSHICMGPAGGVLSCILEAP